VDLFTKIGYVFLYIHTLMGFVYFLNKFKLLNSAMIENRDEAHIFVVDETGPNGVDFNQVFNKITITQIE
jgi:hypothetical protein